jgi:hypothetical protein
MILCLSLLFALGALRPTPADQPPARSSDFLYLWASSADSSEADFLAVYDVRDRPSATRYGALVTTIAVPGRANRTHHTEHDMPPDGQLFANGFGSGQSFVFDLTRPATPRLATQFGDVGPLMHPHSFWRLPSGNVLATFQMQHDPTRHGTGRPGGDDAERRRCSPGLRQSCRASTVACVRIPPPYFPALDRVVVTTSDMDNRDTTQRACSSGASPTSHSSAPSPCRLDRAVTRAIAPPSPACCSDGRSVLVSTFNCGMYLIEDVASATPRARLVASFPRKPGTSCAVPIVAGNYYLITVPAWSAVVSLDISDPARPREVSRITLGANDVPHWIGMEPNRQRVVITGYQAMKTQILMARFDVTTGRLAIDERFRAEGSPVAGHRMEGIAWPHGGHKAAVPHGAVFSRPM